MDILYYKSIPNTNTKLLELSKKNAKSWTALWTANQTKGRGYSGNKWNAEPNQNIALSLLIVSELNYDELIYFNQWISNSVASVLKRICNQVYVKWPNDLIIADKKVCGILIETRKRGNEMFIVTGIGLNVNQTNFENTPKASSLRLLTDQEYDLKVILSEILTEFKSTYYQIENKDWIKISEIYESALFKKDELGVFKENNLIFEAIIQGVSPKGELILKMRDGQIRYFAHKAVELLY